MQSTRKILRGGQQDLSTQSAPPSIASLPTVERSLSPWPSLEVAEAQDEGKAEGRPKTSRLLSPITSSDHGRRPRPEAGTVRERGAGDDAAGATLQRAPRPASQASSSLSPSAPSPSPITPTLTPRPRAKEGKTEATRAPSIARDRPIQGTGASLGLSLVTQEADRPYRPCYQLSATTPVSPLPLHSPALPGPQGRQHHYGRAHPQHSLPRRSAPHATCRRPTSPPTARRAPRMHTSGAAQSPEWPY